MDKLKAIWESMLDADMNERYWTCLSRNYFKRDRYIKIFLAVMTSGVVASWNFWADIQIIWKVLSAIAALTAIISPIMKLEKSVENLSAIKGKWKKVLSGYEILWLSRNDKKEDELIAEYGKIKEKEDEIDEQNFPVKKKLILKIQDEVLKSRGISNDK